jgi:hypothetical protein
LGGPEERHPGAAVAAFELHNITLRATLKQEWATPARGQRGAYLICTDVKIDRLCVAQYHWQECLANCFEVAAGFGHNWQLH